MRRNMLLIIATAALAATASAQGIATAKAGLIHYMEGVVLLDGAEVQQTGDQFVSMKEGQTLSTERGRAEVLLNAGSYLRIGEDSSIKLTSAALDDTRLALLSGSVVIEVSELPKETSARLELLGSEIALKKRGLYEFTADAPGRVRVYEGEVALTSPGAIPIKVDKGREIAFNDLKAGPGKFEQSDTSELYNWASRRAGYIARANESAARSTYASIQGSRNLGVFSGMNSFYRGVWVFDPFFGMYTYLPVSGIGYSPYGFSVLSPVAYFQRVVQVAQPFPNDMGAAGRNAISSPVYTRSAGSSVGGGAAVSAAPSAPVASPNTGGGGDAGRRR